jgi:membrane-bound serine protease (ClpP class)
LIGALALVSSLGLMGIVGIALKARLRPVVSGREQLIGASGTALTDVYHEGEVFVHSERWSAVSDSPLHKGQTVEVTGIDGLTLKVRPIDE